MNICDRFLLNIIRLMEDELFSYLRERLDVGFSVFFDRLRTLKCGRVEDSIGIFLFVFVLQVLLLRYLVLDAYV